MKEKIPLKLKFVFRTTGLALVATLAVGIVALSGPSAQAADASVDIKGFAFAPATITVNVGDTVTWTNSDAGIPHTVTSDTAGVFDSGTLSTGGTFARQFNSAGSFAYHCTIHPSMMATVVVSAAAPSPTAAASPTIAASPTSAPSPTTTTAASPTATTAAPTATASVTNGTAPTPISTPTATATTSIAPAPPATGTGSGGGSNSIPLVIGLAATVLALAGGFALVRRRSGAV